MIIKVTPDIEKVKSVIKLAEKRIEFAKTIDINRFSTMAVENYYEIIKELSSAFMLLRGCKFIGENAHKDIINELRKYDFLAGEDIEFLQDLRIKRNLSYYEGKQINKIYLDNNLNKIVDVTNRIKIKINNTLPMEKDKVVSFVLFGGTGDLVKRKLAPAFADLLARKIISSRSKIVGVGRKQMSDDEYKKILVDSVEGKLKKEIESLDVNYVSADFSNPSEVGKIGESLKHCDITGCNRIYYLSTGFKFFPSIVLGLKKYGLDKEKKGFTRIVFEKPFGSGLRNSNELDKAIHDVFKEENVFRIDHYLAKEAVKELVSLKLNDNKFSSLLNSKNVSEIEVRSDEDLGVGERLEYYNESGALKDMVQNHLLQLLSITLANFKSNEEMHEKKVEVLKKLKVVNSKDNLLGQYNSYSKELNKKELRDVRRETFVNIVLECKDDNWKGVKLILRTGKMLGKKESYIKIKFKDGKEKLFSIYPGRKGIDEYSFLIENAVNGNKDYFASDAEVKECWRIVEDIEKMKDKIRFVKYENNKSPV